MMCIYEAQLPEFSRIQCWIQQETVTKTWSSFNF